jgi:hypothetical protein
VRGRRSLGDRASSFPFLKENPFGAHSRLHPSLRASGLLSGACGHRRESCRRGFAAQLPGAARRQSCPDRERELRAGAGRRRGRQWRRQGMPFRTFARATTNNSGRFSRSFRPTTTALYRARVAQAAQCLGTVSSGERVTMRRSSRSTKRTSKR